MTVSREAFEAQMRCCRRRATRDPARPPRAFAELPRADPREVLVITIDDGWRTMYDVAFPS